MCYYSIDAGRGIGGALGAGKWGHQCDSFRGRSYRASTRRILEPAFLGSLLGSVIIDLDYIQLESLSMCLMEYTQHGDMLIDVKLKFRNYYYL